MYITAVVKYYLLLNVDYKLNAVVMVFVTDERKVIVSNWANSSKKKKKSRVQDSVETQDQVRLPKLKIELTNQHKQQSIFNVMSELGRF
ncbi:hypothetical protein QVD17_10130 [Tagetes erecta]|uniref:Uncharacterized protein n=1 Tax=Tagetes erecta TaxID=13708 RepID=A0AAD8L5X9_TARER|nr:hypothetical protein QVD17_10130 [Tagetes erecta]